MKKFIILLVLGLCCSLGKSYGQKYDNIIYPSRTSVTGARYEVLQLTVPNIVLLDKFQGRVWEGNYEKLTPIPIEHYEKQISKIDATQVNYQIYVSEQGNKYLLVNIHTGEAWSYTCPNPVLGPMGPRIFKKIVTP